MGKKPNKVWWRGNDGRFDGVFQARYAASAVRLFVRRFGVTLKPYRGDRGWPGISVSVVGEK